MPEQHFRCCLCHTHEGRQRGVEIRLQRDQAGRMIWRDVDGLLPVCDLCIQGFFSEVRRPAWPLISLGAAMMLSLQGRLVLAGAFWIIALWGLYGYLIRPSRTGLFRRLQDQIFHYASHPIEGFEKKDLVEIVLERKILFEFPKEGPPKATKL